MRATVKWSVVLAGMSLLVHSFKENTMDILTQMVFVGASLLCSPGGTRSTDPVVTRKILAIRSHRAE